MAAFALCGEQHLQCNLFFDIKIMKMTQSTHSFYFSRLKLRRLVALSVFVFIIEHLACFQIVIQLMTQN